MVDRDMYQVYIHKKKFINTVLKYHLELQYKNLTVFLIAKMYCFFLQVRKRLNFCIEVQSDIFERGTRISPH